MCYLSSKVTAVAQFVSMTVILLHCLVFGIEFREAGDGSEIKS